MRFNRNIYMRLRHIAFFMPNVWENKDTEFSLPAPGSFPIAKKKKLGKRFLKEIIYFLSVNSDSNFHTAINYMRIEPFEAKLVLVCIAVYMNLSNLFSPYEKKFKQRKKEKTPDKHGLEDNCESFCKSIPSDAISKDEVKEKSYGMFLSVRAACYFYCKFNPCFLLYSFSCTIKRHKSEIPILAYLRDELANYLCCFPVESFDMLNNRLSDLQETIDLYFICRDAFEKLQKNERRIWNKWLGRIRDGIAIRCIGTTKELSAESKIPISKRIFNLDFDPVPDKEKKRREKISEAQNKRLSERQEKVQKNISIICSKRNSKKTSMKQACDLYFQANESELKKINITSARTLQNLCSRTKSDKQRSDFVSMSYISPKYSKDFQESIEKVYLAITS